MTVPFALATSIAFPLMTSPETTWYVSTFVEELRAGHDGVVGIRSGRPELLEGRVRRCEHRERAWPDSVSARPACWTSATSVEKSVLPAAISTIVFVGLAAGLGASDGGTITALIAWMTPFEAPTSAMTTRADSVQDDLAVLERERDPLGLDGLHLRAGLGGRNRRGRGDPLHDVVGEDGPEELLAPW